MPDTDTDTTERTTTTESGNEVDHETVALATESSGGNDDTPAGEEQEPDENAETFPRSYVEKLRTENARYRERAKTADTYAERLHIELVRATGRLADPTDLEFDEAHLDDPDALAGALDDLLARKPHLATRRPSGDIGQGATASSSTVNLAELLRQRA